MKILDRYILKSFITTFASVFIILFFIFVLQAIWLFISELAGKDLDVWLIIKFLVFYSPKIVPLVLPLSILLASIMTFGNFAENYEFAAMKSSGISLNRAMKGLTIFICGLSIVAFFFANNVIPKAEYKFLNLRKNIIQRKPAMAIVEGQFNAIGKFNIKVDKKDGENGEKLTGVTIHKRNFGDANATIIRSKRGLLKSSEKSNLLQLELFDGYYYEEVNSKKPAERIKRPFAKSSFSKQIMNIDLTMLNSDNMDEEKISSTNNMLNISELKYTLDSLETSYVKESKSIADNIAQRYNAALVGIPTHKLNKPQTGIEIKRDSMPKNILDLVVAKDDKIRVLDIANNNITSAGYIVQSGKAQIYDRTKNINGHWLALYEKFVIAFSCILMFFIGAPLGAIIRKGGLGLPIVFAVLIFIIFHFINTFGRKLAGENGIPPFLGAWMSSFVLSPLAVFLTYRATNDMNVSISFDWIVVPFQRLFAKDTSEEQPVFNLDNIAISNTEEWNTLRALTDDALIQMVRNAKQHSYTPEYRKKILKILEERNILQDKLKEDGNLYNIEYLKAEYSYSKYKAYTRAALISYIVVLAGIPFLSKGAAFIIPAVLGIVAFYLAIYRIHANLKKIGLLFNSKVGANLIIHLLFGIPFFIFIHLYNRTSVKKTLHEHNINF